MSPFSFYRDDQGYFMNINKGSKKNLGQVLDVKLEFASSENWQMRLLQAFEMLMEGNDASSLTKGVYPVEWERKRKEE